jgi:hypothetical protein
MMQEAMADKKAVAVLVEVQVEELVAAQVREDRHIV